ncbi:MAG: zinc ABC transporter substrate-binding protein [Deltaproteobacteria bacterium]|nr:zinc ABC transporter substrate-binding protein [Deltaproteobacteria bacterium]
MLNHSGKRYRIIPVIALCHLPTVDENLPSLPLSKGGEARRGRIATKLAMLVILLFKVLNLAPSSVSAQTLQACVTVPELGSLLQEVGGEHVTVTVFAKGTEDPHFVEAKPSFIKALSSCDLYVQIGMELEIGWAPILLREAGNGKVLPGAPGHIDASTVITPLEVPSAPVDRSMGDVHPFGNPHYLLDPLNGLKVAALLRDRLSDLQPANTQSFTERYQAFRQRLGITLVGEPLAKKYEYEKLALLFERGKLLDFLQSQGDDAQLGGWLSAMWPHSGAKVVVDHNMWPYFAHRFGITIVDSLEPKPGIPPTTAHLSTVVNRMKQDGITTVLAAAYYDPRYAQFISENTGATVVNMAHQAGARPGTDDYLALIDYNVRQLAAALGGKP